MKHDPKKYLFMLPLIVLLVFCGGGGVWTVAPMAMGTTMTTIIP